MVGRLGPDLGARGPTRGGTRPCGGGGAQPSGMARGLSSRPEGAAAPGRRARNLGRSEQTGSVRRASGRSPSPPPARFPRGGSCPRPGPGPRPFPLGRPRSRRRTGRDAGLRLRLGEKRRREEPGLWAGSPIQDWESSRPRMTPSPKPLRAPLPLPRSPGTFPPCVRRLGLASGPPSTGHVARSLPPCAHCGPLLRWQRLPPSALPQPHASSPCSPRRGGPPVAPCPPSLVGNLRKPFLLPPTWATSPYAPLTALALAVTAPHQAALISPGPGPPGPDRPCPDRRSHMEPQPLPRKAGARAWPPSPYSRRASSWGPAPGPAAPAVLSPARGLLLGCPDLTDSSASGRLAARLFPGALNASLSAHKEWQRERRKRPSRSPIGRRPVKGLGRSRQAASWLRGPLRPLPPDRAWSRQSGRQASPLQRCPCTVPPLRPGTRGSPGRPARAPCPHLPAAGQMLRARGLAPSGVPAPPPPKRRRLPGRQRCEAAAPGTATLGSRAPPGSMRGPENLSTGVTRQPERDSGALKFCAAHTQAADQGDSDRRQQAVLPRSWPRGGPGWPPPICRGPHGTSFADIVPPPRDPGPWVPPLSSPRSSSEAREQEQWAAFGEHAGARAVPGPKQVAESLQMMGIDDVPFPGTRPPGAPWSQQALLGRP
nr:basic proline-rich protein-like [Odocoileus virginianus texanus]